MSFSTLGRTDDLVRSYVYGDPDKKADINVFSVASGHLYERLLRIMMRSVLEHAKGRKVKFWIIQNFLSPTFRDFIPFMAQHYHFEYELITYKWPQWLRGQTEKQRKIWGYVHDRHLVLLYLLIRLCL